MNCIIYTKSVMRRAFLALILLMITASACFADMETSSGKSVPSARINIPVSHEIFGDKYSGSDEFSYTLTAEDPDDPMPADSIDGTKTVTVKGAGSIDFGDIEFEHPDTYYYIVKETTAESKTIKPDSTVYRVMIAKYTGDTAQIITWSTASNEKCDQIIFKEKNTAPNKADDPSKPSVPKTGDDLSFGLTALCFSFAVVLITLINLTCVRRKESRKDEE